MVLPEVWLRGPVERIPALLQPVAHSLLQCREEVVKGLADLSPEEIFHQPAGVASVGFHVRHATGSLDRLLTYARGESLSPEQMAALRSEAEVDPSRDAALTLIALFEAGVDRALDQLRAADQSRLLEWRGVGRSQLPSTTLGLLFHAAEHTQRHIGQMVTTAKIVKAALGAQRTGTVNERVTTSPSRPSGP
jgi:uncharacterized damage-inducible protein DinB